MPTLSKYWQAEMLGLDMAELEKERFVEEAEPAPRSSWVKEFEALDYRRRVDMARRAQLLAMRSRMTAG